MKSTSSAPANIALIKYWGKRDEALILPQHGSIAMNLDGLSTTTTVEFADHFSEDEVTFDGVALEGNKRDKVVRHLELIRAYGNVDSIKARVASTANFPMAAGLASSSSGFAALTLAAASALGLSLSERELSILARQGSGSASRSIPDGFTEWYRGTLTDGSDSYAETIQSEDDDFGLRLIVTISSSTEKKVTSRAGMSEAVATSPYYPAWLESVDGDLEEMRSAMLSKDFDRLGRVAEKNAVKMHCTAFTAQPPTIYWQASTMALIHWVLAKRELGEKVYFTIDGGPQVKVLCRAADAARLADELDVLPEVERTIVCKACAGARVTEDHLF